MRGLLILILTLAAGPVAAAEPDPWAALRGGGIALFRHANAPGTGDPPGYRLEDCATQRNLDDSGRRQAEAIGARFRAEGVVVGRVLSSRWCRCLETARLAFPGEVGVETAFNSFFDERGDGPEITARARRILAEWRGPGALVVVTHQVNITALTGIHPRSGEGVALTVSPDGVKVVGRLP